MKIGFIGFGNMGQAIAKGLVRHGGVRGEDIYAFARDQKKLRQSTEALGANAVSSAQELVSCCELIIPAIIPSAAPELLSPLGEALKEKLIVSIMAGYDFERLDALIPGTRHISTIPNTPISTGAGILVCEDKNSLSEEEYEAFRALFSPVALIETVSASQFSVAGTLGGCAPAFTAMYMEALADGAVKYGLNRDTAYRMAAQMVIGTGRLCLEGGEHPAVLKDRVCSPGGTTIRGVSALEKRGFRAAVIDALDAIEGE